MTYLRFRLLGLIGGWGGELKCLFGVSFSKFLGSGCTDCSALGFAAFVMWPGFYRFNLGLLQFGSGTILRTLQFLSIKNIGDFVFLSRACLYVVYCGPGWL